MDGYIFSVLAQNREGSKYRLREWKGDGRETNHITRFHLIQLRSPLTKDIPLLIQVINQLLEGLCDIFVTSSTPVLA